MRAARMSLADVVQQLRKEEEVWFYEVNWRAKRRNARAQERGHEERERERERERRYHAGGSHDSSAGTPRTSDASPVLSTSTLGTTPTPPPPGERKALGVDVEERKREIKSTISASPVLNPPRLSCISLRRSRTFHITVWTPFHL
jgi:hypothetical protein